MNIAENGTETPNNEFKARGMSILLVSSDMPEVLGMSDRGEGFMLSGGARSGPCQHKKTWPQSFYCFTADAATAKVSGIRYTGCGTLLNENTLASN